MKDTYQDRKDFYIWKFLVANICFKKLSEENLFSYHDLNHWIEVIKDYASY